MTIVEELLLNWHLKGRQEGAVEEGGNGAVLESPYNCSLSLASLGILPGTQVVLQKPWLSRAHLQGLAHSSLLILPLLPRQDISLLPLGPVTGTHCGICQIVL